MGLEYFGFRAVGLGIWGCYSCSRTGHSCYRTGESTSCTRAELELVREIEAAATCRICVVVGLGSRACSREYLFWVVPV